MSQRKPFTLLLGPSPFSLTQALAPSHPVPTLQGPKSSAGRGTQELLGMSSAVLYPHTQSGAGELRFFFHSILPESTHLHLLPFFLGRDSYRPTPCLCRRFLNTHLLNNYYMSGIVLGYNGAYNLGKETDKSRQLQKQISCMNKYMYSRNAQEGT